MDVIFVRSEDNESDILTKNVTVKLQEKFSNKIRNGKLRIYEEWKNIAWAVDNPIAAQREDVVNYVHVEQFDQAIDVVKSNESNHKLFHFVTK